MTGNGSKQVREYSLRSPGNRWLAEIIIRDDGYFSTVSEYGRYVYWWGSAGDNFREFLIDCDSDYLLTKFCGRCEEYDGDRTVKAVKEHILRHRRELGVSRENARKEWDLFDRFSNLESREDFARWYDQTSLDCAYEFAVYDYPGQARGFMERVLPVFKDVLRAELAAEKAASAA